MAQQNYDEAIRRVLAHEGGFTNNPADPGGATNFGITIADYRKYIRAGATAGDVAAMTVDEAKAIYKKHYWDAVRGDDLPSGIDYCVFDYGINSGTSRSIKVLQRVLVVADDGVIGPKTMGAVTSADPAHVIQEICDERLSFLKSLSTWPVFGDGWSRRVADVRTVSLAMSGKHPQPDVPKPQKQESLGFFATINKAILSIFTRS